MRLEHLLSGAPYEDDIRQYICSIIKNGTEKLETAPSRRKRQESPEERSSTVRGKQDRNPALLLGYTFVYETIQEMQHEVACHAQLHDSSVAQLVRAPH